ncbi:hypothetical protein CCANI_13070 [Corynebacterium canis]|nr:hypothetical protein CCANI_13070 [Corynebacterium canis]
MSDQPNVRISHETKVIMKDTDVATQGDLTQLSAALDVFGDVFGTLGVVWFNLLQALNR